MLRFENSPVTVPLSGLLAAAAALQELGGNLHDLGRVPDILRKVLAAESVSVTVTHTREEGGTEILVQSTSESPFTHGTSAKTASGGDRIISFEHDLDSTHHMKMVVCRAPVDAEETSVADDILNILSNHLVRSLQALFGGLAYPPRLERPFTDLTKREWKVLCGLDSDEGEKEIAHRMHLSSHTLHSHIKSLYRKIGVRGRLALLKRFRAARREYRMGMLAQPLEKGPDLPRALSQITVVEQNAPFGYPAGFTAPLKK